MIGSMNMMKKSLKNVLSIGTLCLLFCLSDIVCNVEALSLTGLKSSSTSSSTSSSMPSWLNRYVVGAIALVLLLLVIVVPIAVSVGGGEASLSGDLTGDAWDAETSFLNGYEDGWNIGHDDTIVDQFSDERFNADHYYDIYGNGEDELMWKAGFMEANDRADAGYDVDGGFRPSGEYDNGMFSRKYDGVEGREYAIQRWNFSSWH